MGTYGMNLPQCESIESRLNKIKNDIEQCRKAVRMAAQHIEHAGGYGLRSVHEKLMDTSRDIGKYNDLAQDLRSCLIEAETITRKCEKDVYKKITYDWRDKALDVFKGFGQVLKFLNVAKKVKDVITWAQKLEIPISDIGQKLGKLAKAVTVVKCFWDNVIINREGNNFFRALAETAIESGVNIGISAGLSWITGVLLAATPAGWAIAVGIGCFAGSLILQNYFNNLAKNWTKGKSENLGDAAADWVLGDFSKHPDAQTRRCREPRAAWAYK